MPVCAQEHGRYHPTPPHPHHPTPPTLKPDGVADEGKMVSQMRENQGGFGVTDEGDLVSQMRGLPRWALHIVLTVTPQSFQKKEGGHETCLQAY